MGTKYGREDYADRMGRMSPSQRIMQSLQNPRQTAARFSGKRQVLVLVFVIVALYLVGTWFERRPVEAPVLDAQGVVYLKEVRGTGPDREYVVGVRVTETNGNELGLTFSCSQELWTQLANNDEVTVTYRFVENGARAVPLTIERNPAIDRSGSQSGSGGSAALEP
ncbi:MAG: hypothetical protein K1Y02_08770 [Candidatus Hydrogenedentes bacterium]|nr:hypothetical protein [Candidatus Hydrogenedentota bacterium]